MQVLTYVAAFGRTRSDLAELNHVAASGPNSGGMAMINPAGRVRTAGWSRDHRFAGALLTASSGKAKIAVQPDAPPTWLERPGGGQVFTEALMRMNQQAQLSRDRL
jgi:hypothetical protein